MKLSGSVALVTGGASGLGAATVRRLYQDWNKRDFDHLSSLYTRTGEIVLVGSGTRFQGPEGAKEHATM